MSMFCYQCEMSQKGGCGSTGAVVGTCGKDENLARLQDIMIFGLKGLCAYREHLNTFKPELTKEVDDVISETLYFTLTNVNFNFNDHINQLMKIGRAGSLVMDRLSNTHVSKFGIPTPVTVSQNKVEGKAILVSGHDLEMFERLLIATQDKGINVYTHSEMLPAHGYPELRKYKHLKGNVGKAWFDQAKLMEKFPGTFVVNTNCIIPPKKNCGYLDRLFTYKIVGVEGSTPIENDNFGEWIIDRKNKGTLENPIQMPYITYSNMVDHFIEDVYDFVSKHPEYELNRYYDILETNNIKWEKESMQNTDVSSLDGKCVVALLVGTVRAERFCDGVLLSFFKSGVIKKWLLRLKEIDEE